MRVRQVNATLPQARTPNSSSSLQAAEVDRSCSHANDGEECAL